ncbi:hypothetical protein [Mycolicibacter heraklionensis]|nr:hypothetical protein [Mycolicibacter heraklionensis]
MSDTRAVFTVTINDYDPDVVKVLRHVVWGLENVRCIQVEEVGE